MRRPSTGIFLQLKLYFMVFWFKLFDYAQVSKRLSQITFDAFDPKQVLPVLGNNMRRLRYALGLTQEDVADLSGLSVVYVSGCERGIRNVSLMNISAIAFALRTDMTELVDLSRRGETVKSTRIYNKVRARKTAS
jgi:DNA-binding XRE family transcriptional regulator